MAGWHRLLVGALVVSASAALSGCSDPYAGRQEISGTVKLEGNPLKDGIIFFEPVDKSLGTPGSSPVTNGEFKVTRDSGVKPGTYLVRITSGDGKTPADSEAGNPGGSTNIVSFDRIPEDWNVKSQQQVEVKADGKNKFDFEIPKARTPKSRR